MSIQYRFIISLLPLISLAACDTGAGRTLSRGYRISPLFLDGTEPNTPQPEDWDSDACQHPKGDLPADCVYLRRGFSPPIYLKSYTGIGNDRPLIELAENSQSKRNELERDLIRRSNKICNGNRAELVAVKDTYGFGFGAAGAVAGGVGGVVSGVAANVMSGVSGLMSGLEGQASKNFYQSTLDYAILQEIDTLQKTDLENINTNASKSISQYPPEQMLIDVNQYHEDCSFVNALNALLKAASSKAAQTGNVTGSPSGGASAGGDKPKPTTTGSHTNSGTTPSSKADGSNASGAR